MISITLLKMVVNFCLTPSQIGTHGDNKAGMAAKSAIKFQIAKFKISHTDFKCITTYKVNKPCNFGLKRKDKVISSRMRFGHSKLTHSYLLKGEQ